MRTCYLAGPMTGYADYNFPRFFSVAKQLRDGGFQVISPAELDVAAGIDYKSTTGGALAPFQIRQLIQRDITAILSLRAEDGDFIALLPGWEFSRGAGAEVYTGQWAGLKLRAVVPSERDISLVSVQLRPVAYTVLPEAYLTIPNKE